MGHKEHGNAKYLYKEGFPKEIEDFENRKEGWQNGGQNEVRSWSRKWLSLNSKMEYFQMLLMSKLVETPKLLLFSILKRYLAYARRNNLAHEFLL